MERHFDKSAVIASIRSKLEYHFGVSPTEASDRQLYEAAVMSIEDILTARRREFEERVEKDGSKQAYYLCMEFLLGRSLKNNLFNLGLTDIFREAMREFGYDLDELYELEPDAGLGNGGLGRLAACFLDSAATMGYPVTGYSIRYDYGIFRQKIVDGWQTELPDMWLPGGEVWLVPRVDEAVKVGFDGTVREEWKGGFHHVTVTGGYTVMAVPYDMMISGYHSDAVCALRLWSARNPDIDIGLFNQGDYMRAMEQSAMAEVISKVLYPSDNHPEGKSLRLRQQYFLVSASAQDIIRRHLSRYNTLDNMPDKIAIHINETHPALIIPELMRILLDDCGYGWDAAWDLVTRTVAYTNHTVMGEALEVWPEDIFKARLPRIYQIVREINERLCRGLWEIYPNDWKKISYMSIVAYGHIRMANLCLAACHSVNGVSKIHSDIIRRELFADYARTWPDKFRNVTNGITHRRWLCQANPELTRLVGELIGPGFVTDAAQLEGLRRFADDGEVLRQLEQIKRHNKERMARYIASAENIAVDPASIFDVQVKRLHEYKRQLLNALHILSLYDQLKADPNREMPPRTFLFGAKAAPGYRMAKVIIRLICSIAREIDGDPAVRDRLRVVFLEDYRVTLAEMLMPAAEISEQISLAGTEASGTGNMKLMVNGAVTIGTLDGANVEMREAVGDDNIFIFGLKADQVERLKADGYNPFQLYQNNPVLREVIDHLRRGVGGVAFPEIVSSLTGVGAGFSDPYLVLADFADYARVHEAAQARYLDRPRWNRMSLMNIAGAARFSSDRALSTYAEDIWKIGRV